jgi:bifunctional DNase/RNase
MRQKAVFVVLVSSVLIYLSVMIVVPLDLGDDYYLVDNVTVSGAASGTSMLTFFSEGYFLDMFISDSQGLSIESAILGLTTTRPMTHDLQVDMLRATGTRVLAVSVDTFVENYFTATLYLRTGPFISVLDCRPSDCTALALRTNAPIYVHRQLLIDSIYNQANVSDIVVA